jgi:hypothetical protein
MGEVCARAEIGAPSRLRLGTRMLTYADVWWLCCADVC